MRTKLNPFSWLFLFVTSLLIFVKATSDSEESPGTLKYKIDGKVSVPFSNDQEWLSTTRIMVDGGEFVGFLK